MRYALVCSLFFICLAFAQPVYTQNNFAQTAMDSLQQVFSHQKAAKDITVDTKEGEGSVFTVYLPIS